MKLRNNLGQFTNRGKVFNSYVAKFTVGTFILLGLLLLINHALVTFNNWSASNKLIIQKPLVLLTRPMVEITKRQPLQVLSPLAEEITHEVPSELNDVEQLILDVFGERDFQVARAVAKSESGLNCEAYNVNTNGTFDYGVFQINAIHFDRFGGLKNLITCEQQVRAAHELYMEQGWNPWVVYQLGIFKENL